MEVQADGSAADAAAHQRPAPVSVRCQQVSLAFLSASGCFSWVRLKPFFYGKQNKTSLWHYKAFYWVFDILVPLP